MIFFYLRGRFNLYSASDISEVSAPTKNNLTHLTNIFPNKCASLSRILLFELQHLHKKQLDNDNDNEDDDDDDIGRFSFSKYVNHCLKYSSDHLS